METVKSANFVGTMGLDKFTSPESSGTADYSTRKKIENVKLDETQWRHLLYHYPGMIEVFCGSWEDNEVKAALKLIDRTIEEGARGIKMTESKREELRESKKEIIEDHL